MKRWYIPDGFWHSKSTGGEFVSHEAVCVLNTNPQAARVALALYFEDRDKMEGFSFTVEPERTMHIRMDKIVNRGGQPVPKDTPYAIVVESELDLSVQYTRVDTSQSALTMASTIV